MRRPQSRNRVAGGVAIRDLPAMTRAELLDAWARIVGKPAIRNASRELLVNAIAWHLQAQQHGGLSPSVRRKLERLAAAIDRGENVGPRSPIDRIRPGTTLERRWRGETHVVFVTADGFTYRSNHYRSLSEIARLITGTRWNGPAFFGLRSKKSFGGSDDAR